MGKMDEKKIEPDDYDTLTPDELDELMALLLRLSSNYESVYQDDDGIIFGPSEFVADFEFEKEKKGDLNGKNGKSNI